MRFVIGIDEVGRGSWAGPLLVVAARAKAGLPDGLADSKLLSRVKRQELYDLIVRTCEIGEGWVEPEEIDEYGLSRAMKLGVLKALIGLGALPEDEIIMDGSVNYCPDDYMNVKTIIKADSLHPIVSAASIYAKVTRDNYMARISSFYPDYQFEKHVGYGTKLHQELLKTYGVSKIHRQSFKPIKNLT